MQSISTKRMSSWLSESTSRTFASRTERRFGRLFVVSLRQGRSRKILMWTRMRSAGSNAWKRPLTGWKNVRKSKETACTSRPPLKRKTVTSTQIPNTARKGGRRRNSKRRTRLTAFPMNRRRPWLRDSSKTLSPSPSTPLSTPRQ